VYFKADNDVSIAVTVWYSIEGVAQDNSLTLIPLDVMGRSYVLIGGTFEINSQCFAYFISISSLVFENDKWTF